MISRRSTHQHPLLLGGLAVLAALLGGCGGEADSGEAREGHRGDRGDEADRGRRVPARAPKPTESLDDAARRFASAVEEKDCEVIRSQGSFGAKPLDEQVCGRLLQRLEGLRRERLESYGTAGVVGFTTERGDGAVAFLVGPDGRYRWATWSAGPEGRSVVGSRPRAGDRLDRLAEESTAALREGRCDELVEQARGIVPDPQAPRRICLQLEGVRKQLAKDRQARPQRLGANSRYAFYSLLPQPGGPYVTLVLLQEGARAALQRVVPVPADRPGAGKKRPPVRG